MRLIHELYIKLIKNFTINKAKYLFLIFLFFPILIILIVIKPILLIRFGYFDIKRIGIISSAEHYLLHNKKKKYRLLDIWVIDTNTYNKQLLIILERLKIYI